MAFVVKPPNDFRSVDYDYRCAVFLGGSIELGKADEWQVRVEDALSDIPVLILNPRRKDWNWDWPQDPTPGTEFYKQVVWEQEALHWVDTRVFYFCANAKAPITLMEFGQYHDKEHTHVFCPSTFWRYGNVKMMCDRARIKCHDSEEEFIRALRISVMPT